MKIILAIAFGLALSNCGTINGIISDINDTRPHYRPYPDWDYYHRHCGWNSGRWCRDWGRRHRL